MERLIPLTWGDNPRSFRSRTVEHMPEVHARPINRPRLVELPRQAELAVKEEAYKRWASPKASMASEYRLSELART